MILFLFVYFIYLIYRSTESMHMLQQNLYNENNRYIRWLKRNHKRIYNLFDFVPLLFFPFVFFIKDKGIIDFTMVASAIIYMYCIYIEYRRNKENQNKIPLKATHRIKRIFITIMILYLIPSLVLLKMTNNVIMASFLILLVLMIGFVYYMVYFATWLNTPIDKIEMYFYLQKAKKKLKSYNSLDVIGVTGSYGKTSSKNILEEILSSKYITRKSPMNYNTLKGLMITVNNYLDKFDEIFIAEMGAYVCGEIKEICEFIKPKYGILTLIGESHLETFKTKENIQKAKFELIESLDKNGLAILNMDDPLQVGYELKNPVKKIWISIENHEADFYATDIEFNNQGMKFKCHYGDKVINLHTRLLGKHNVYNILASVALAINLGISEEDIKISVSTLKPTEHRLELKRIGNFYQLDDAYNSNPVGARSALEVLSLMNGDKCVVTPGMIELGNIEKEKNYEFGKEISEVANYVILIGKKRTEAIYKALIDNKFDKDNIFILNSVVDAYKVVNSLINPERKMYALFENDLPDIYTEGE